MSLQAGLRHRTESPDAGPDGFGVRASIAFVDNVVIQSVSTEKVYVPRYEPEMLYEPGYPVAPISYYPEPYPSYWYPTATFFAAAVTGAAWAAVVDWDDWGVWDGRWATTSTATAASFEGNQ